MRPVRTVITVDDRTGEVKSMDTTYVSSPKREPSYIKLYIDGIAGLRDIPLYCWPVLLCMLEKVHYANSEQCFEFGAPMRNKVAGELHVKIGKVNHAISDLVKCGAILRSGRGLYQFNPTFFARGEWKDIQKLRSVVDGMSSEGG